ncbi:unnamed protein product [Chironomus riparius]|uniref:Globin domain-containing protein n=1 Tax=Chironomus riparius TaxID=315576 RepID=A0A9N9WMD9_9DIPT|nr:unnamed protein product [Chironomus riparius]
MKYLAILVFCVAAVSAQYEMAPIVQASFNEVRHNEADILYNIFKSYPGIQARFPQFAGKDPEEIKETAEFAIHAGRIINFISEVLSLAGSPSNLPAVKTLLNQLGESHRIRGITRSQFDDFHKALIGYIQTHGTWNDEISTAWNRVEINMHKILYAALDGHPIN